MKPGCSATGLFYFRFFAFGLSAFTSGIVCISKGEEVALSNSASSSQHILIGPRLQGSREAKRTLWF